MSKEMEFFKNFLIIKQIEEEILNYDLSDSLEKGKTVVLRNGQPFSGESIFETFKNICRDIYYQKMYIKLLKNFDFNGHDTWIDNSSHLIFSKRISISRTVLLKMIPILKAERFKPEELHVDSSTHKFLLPYLTKCGIRI